MILVALGFMVPGFIDPVSEESGTAVEPRLCKSDTDCYLNCEGTPIASLCSRNLCLVNSCSEYNLFEYDKDPLSFTLTITLDGNKSMLSDKINPQDFFVKTSGDKVQVFTSGMHLGNILDKMGIQLTDSCLYLDGSQYCRNNEKDLLITVNKEDSFSQVVPEEGNKISIIYE